MRVSERTPSEPLDLFLSRVEAEPSGCWRWKGYLNNKGYGHFRPGGREGKLLLAYKWAYEFFIGPVRDGLQLDHLCRNRWCCNPLHLEPVTPRENTLRGSHPSAIAVRTGFCKRGHELKGDNLYVNATSGSKVCRTCKNNRERDRRRGANKCA